MFPNRASCVDSLYFDSSEVYDLSTTILLSCYKVNRRSEEGYFGYSEMLPFIDKE